MRRYHYAMRPCPECSRHVLLTETACPFCGATVAAAPARARTVVDSVRELGLGVVVAAGLMTAGCSGDKGESESEGTTEMTGEASDGESSTTAGNTSLNTSSGPDTSYQTASAYGGPSYTSSYTTVDSDWTTTASTESTSTSETSSTTATTTTATGATTEDTAESDSSTGDTGTTTG